MNEKTLTPAEQLYAAIRKQAKRHRHEQEAAAAKRRDESRPQGDESATRYLHVSKVYPPNPNYGKALPGGLIDTVPFLELKGRTYIVGRNAAKRAARAAGHRSRA